MPTARVSGNTVGRADTSGSAGQSQPTGILALVVAGTLTADATDRSIGHWAPARTWITVADDGRQ